MVALINIVVQLITDVARFVVLQFRPTRSVQAENLFLRRQLGLFKERGIKPRRVDAATRISLAVLARFFDWRDALIVVQLKTSSDGSMRAGAYSGAGNVDRADPGFPSTYAH